MVFTPFNVEENVLIQLKNVLSTLFDARMLFVSQKSSSFLLPSESL
jgi:hypothetical protein